jgi:chromosome segregation ATPase
MRRDKPPPPFKFKKPSLEKFMSKDLLLVMLTALVAVEHNGVLYGPGQAAGTDFEADKLEAKALLEVGAVEISKADKSVANLKVLGDSLDQEKEFLQSLRKQLEGDAADQDAQRAQLAADQAALASDRNQLDSDKAELAFAKTKLEKDQAALADARTKLDADQATFDAAQAAAAAKKK